jgi:hypothetical protein
MVSDEDIFRLINSSTTISDGSKVAYVKQLRSAQKAFNDKNLSELLLEPGDVERLDAPLATRIAYTNAFNSLFKRDREYSSQSPLDEDVLSFVPKTTREEWSELLKRLHVDRSELVDQNTRSEREEKNWVTEADWKAADDSLSASERGSQTQLLVAFHTRIPPLRGGDLAQVHICEHAVECRDGNVLTLMPPRLIIRDHKTRRKYGNITVNIPTSLADDIAISLEKQPRKYLFTNSRGEEYPTRDAFMTWKSNAFKRVFHKDVTTNIARREYATSEDMNASLSQLKRSAQAMGHSIETHHAYRVVKPKTDEEKPKTDEEEALTQPIDDMGESEKLKGGVLVPYDGITVGSIYRFEYMYHFRHPEEIVYNGVPVRFLGEVIAKDMRDSRSSIIKVRDVTKPLIYNVPKTADYRISMDEWEANMYTQPLLSTLQLGRSEGPQSRIEPANIGKIAEFVGMPVGLERELHIMDVADKGQPGQPESMLRRRGGGWFTDLIKPVTNLFTSKSEKPMQTIQTVVDPRDMQRMCEQAYALFNGQVPVNVGKWDLIKQTPEDLLYRNGNTFVVAVRGTQGAPSGDDWSANVTIPINGLANTVRFRKDLVTVQGWKQEFTGGTWFATGHSLGGAICDELLRAGLVSEAYTFNPAVQTKDFNGKLLNHRVYARGDPLYQLFGRLTSGAVLQPATSMRTELLTRVSPTYFATNALDQHNLSAFDAHDLHGGMALQAAENQLSTIPDSCVPAALQALSVYYPQIKSVADHIQTNVSMIKNDDGKVSSGYYFDVAKAVGGEVSITTSQSVALKYLKEAQEKHYGGLISVYEYRTNAGSEFFSMPESTSMERLRKKVLIEEARVNEISSSHAIMYAFDPQTNLIGFYNPSYDDTCGQRASFSERLKYSRQIDMTRVDDLNQVLRYINFVPEENSIRLEDLILLRTEIDESTWFFEPDTLEDKEALETRKREITNQPGPFYYGGKIIQQRRKRRRQNA